MTVRQVFYRLVSSGVIPKTEASYKNIVVRLLGIMRREGDLPFRWIADNTRWMRKPSTYSSLEHALDNTIATYRRALWDQQDSYVEIWLEKDALAGVLYDVTAEWDVPLMVTRLSELILSPHCRRGSTMRIAPVSSTISATTIPVVSTSRGKLKPISVPSRRRQSCISSVSR